MGPPRTAFAVDVCNASLTRPFLRCDIGVQGWPDENRLRTLLRTADGLRIKGLTEAFHNSNEQKRENFVVRKSEFTLPGRPRTNRVSNNAALKITSVAGAAPHSFVGYDEFEDKMDKKEPDWSDNEDDNDCVRVYLVSEDDEDDFNLYKKKMYDVDANGPLFTQPESFLPLRDVHMKRSNRNTDELAMFAVASTNRIADPLDGQVELEDGEGFDGWYLAPVDDNVKRDERVDLFEVDSISITKNKDLKSFLSSSRNRPQQALVPTLTANNGSLKNRRNKLALKGSLPDTGASSEQPSLSAKSSNRSTSRRSSTGTSQKDLLNRLHGYLQRSFDGSIKELTIDDLQNYSVENEKGTCQVKCPFCDKPIGVQYGKKYGEDSKKFYWRLTGVKRHISRHF